MAQHTTTNWNATQFFEQLTASNRLATSENFVFCRVSGLEGFEEALEQMQSATAFVCVSDIADGYTELNNTPRTRRVKTVFLAMRHAINDMEARAECMSVMQELFRQYMSVLLLERVKLEQDSIYIDPRITFTEIDRYFFSGCACAYFQIAVDRYSDLRYNADEWKDHYAEVGNDYHEYTPHHKGYYLNVIDYHGIYKMTAIKTVRETFGLTLTAAKALFDKYPASVPINLEDTEEIKATIESQGITYSITYQYAEYPIVATS